MSGQKRHFPYYSTVPEIQLGQRTFAGVNPGREYAAPRTFVPMSGAPTAAVSEVLVGMLAQLLARSHVCTNIAIAAWRQGTGTNFTSWTEAEIKVCMPREESISWLLALQMAVLP